MSGTFVALSELADFLKVPDYVTDPVQGPLLQEVLDAALENVESKVGPLESASRVYTVYPNGRALVLPVTHILELGAVTDPHGTVMSADLLKPNLLSGIVTVPSRVPGAWTVRATSQEHKASLKLAVKIIASHLWETQRGRSGGGARAAVFTPAGDGGDAPRMGFAIPARAAELIAPFLVGAY